MWPNKGKLGDMGGDPQFYSQTSKLSPEDIMVWADGTWCFRDEIEQMTHMSDDYRVLLENTEEWETFLFKEGYCRG